MAIFALKKYLKKTTMTTSDQNKAPKLKYEQELRQHEAELGAYQKKQSVTGLIRLFVFLLGLAWLIYIFPVNLLLGFVSTAVWLFVFLFLVNRFRSYGALIKRAKAFIEINRRELEVIEKGISEEADNGKAFKNLQHAYAEDLDLFGPKSLFQLLNRAGTFHGKSALAENLLYPTKEKNQILARQQAIKELASDFNFRQEFLVRANYYTAITQKDFDFLSNWLKQPFKLEAYPNLRKAIKILPYFTAMMGVVAAFGIISPFVLLVGVQIFLLWRAARLLGDQKSDDIAQSTQVLKTYKTLFQLLEVKNFESDLLLNKAGVIQRKGKPASYLIGKIAQIAQNIDIQSNPMFAFFANLLLMWNLQMFLSAEKWRKKHGDKVLKWVETLGEMEALMSFATFAYNHPKYQLAEPSTEFFTFEAKSLGHVLIPEKERVANDYRQEGSPSVHIVTGSNMAGKSTFLRTIGVNLILAMNGSPVCAEKMRFSPCRIYSSMRNIDSLGNQESFFYAELKRLKTIIDEVEQSDDVFFLLDEILKGTNSEDRHKGAKALIKQMIQHKGTGIIATHDLKLSELETQYPQVIRNHHFDVNVNDDQLAFDYKIKNGICRSFNASLLMRKMGINMDLSEG